MFNNYVDNLSNSLKNTIITDKFKNIIDTDKAWEQICEVLTNVKLNDATVFLVGNGGSNGIVSHSSVDFINTCKIKAFPITDSSQITCFANDYGYEEVFSKPLEVMMNKNDVLIAISSSGASKNILNAVNVAVKKSAFVITLSGFKCENPLRNAGNFNIWLNSNSYGIVEIGHGLCLHYITDKFSNKL